VTGAIRVYNCAVLHGEKKIGAALHGCEIRTI
jgi:hypothetical protein